MAKGRDDRYREERGDYRAQPRGGYSPDKVRQRGYSADKRRRSSGYDMPEKTKKSKIPEGYDTKGYRGLGDAPRRPRCAKCAKQQKGRRAPYEDDVPSGSKKGKKAKNTRDDKRDGSTGGKRKKGPASPRQQQGRTQTRAATRRPRRVSRSLSSRGTSLGYSSDAKRRDRASKRRAEPFYYYYTPHSSDTLPSGFLPARHVRRGSRSKGLSRDVRAMSPLPLDAVLEKSAAVPKAAAVEQKRKEGKCGGCKACCSGVEESQIASKA
eukprot:Polyplicarium_translucidae@DN2687_c0_g1_i1.p1